jgi:hypothetical protein
MALIVLDRVRETSNSQGTNDMVLAGAVIGYQGFSAIGNGNTTYYCIAGQGTNEWEVGIGTYDSGTSSLQRTTVLANSSGTEPTKLDFTSGTKDVFVTYPAERSVDTDTSQTLTNKTLSTGTSITAGSINGTTVGASTASTGAFTTLSSTSTTTLNGTTIPASKTLVDTDSSQTLTNKSISGSTNTLSNIGNSSLTNSSVTFNGQTVALGSSGTITSNTTNTLTIGTGLSGGSFNGSAPVTVAIDSTVVTLDGVQTLTNKTLTSPTVNTATISGGTINNASVGATTPSTGAFTNFSASGTADFTSTGSVKIPVGTTAQRPTPAAGMLRFNDDSDEFEGYNGTAWASVGGSAISNDTSTATDLFPSFLSATTGTAASIFTSNAKLLYKPSTGEFKAQELVATNGIVVNSATVSANYTIPTGSNAMSAGPVTVADGITVTVSDGSFWVVV